MSPAPAAPPDADAASPEAPGHSPHAVAAAVRADYDRLIGAVRSLIGCDEATAEDVVSAVVTRVLVRRLSPAPGQPWAAYLLTAVRNEGRNHVRDRARALEAALTLARRQGRDAAAEMVAAGVLLRDALADLSRLTDEERRVFLLRYYFDLTHTQIATVEAVPVATVNNRLRAARAKLAEMQAEREADPAYLPLLALLSPTAARLTRAPVDPATLAGLAASPAAACAAAVAALALLGTTTPGRVADPGGAPDRAPATAVSLLWAANPPAGAPRRDARRAGEGGASAGAPTSWPRPGAPAGPGVTAQVRSCLPDSLVCAAVGDSEGEDDGGPDRLPGDLIGVDGTPVRTSQRVTPVCSTLPTVPPPGRCDGSEDEDDYRVRRPSGPPQEARVGAAKSDPSAPRAEEPPKGTTP